MKTTAILIPLIMVLCATRIVCTATDGDSAALDYEESKIIQRQNDYYIDKRNKPSLSIVNPLDVLRQRLMLEIARRQMKENTRQVELNRAILKNVGKRVYNGKFRYPLSLLPEYQLNLHQQVQQRQQKRQEVENDIPLQLLYKHKPSARASIFDLYQRQAPLRSGVTTYHDIDIDDNDMDADDFDIDDDHILLNKSLDIASVKNQANNKDIEQETNHRNFGRAADVTDGQKYNNDINVEAANRLQYLYQLHKNNFPHK